MQYTVHHACGHEETVVLYGPTKERERRIAAMEQADCPACRAAASHLDGCVDLVGNDKQVAWAGQIRRSFLGHVTVFLRLFPRLCATAIIQAVL